MSIRITERSRHFFWFLAAARAATTGHAYRLYFKSKSMDAARKWLRKHVRAGYIRMHRRDRMSQAIFTLAPAGQRILEREGSGERPLLRMLPKQIEHVLGINDIRVAAELGYDLAYFYACWELSLNWREAVIPDALFSAGGRVFAVEYDRGLETLACFMRKITVYRRGFSGLQLTAVLIVTDSEARMRSLARAIADESGRFSTRRSSCEECMAMRRHSPEALFSESLGERTRLRR